MGETSPLPAGKPLGLAATGTRAIPRCACWRARGCDGLSLPPPSEPREPSLCWGQASAKGVCCDQSLLLRGHRPPTVCVAVAAGPCLVCWKQPSHREVTFLGGDSCRLQRVFVDTDWGLAVRLSGHASELVQPKASGKSDGHKDHLATGNLQGFTSKPFLASLLARIFCPCWLFTSFAHTH